MNGDLEYLQAALEKNRCKLFVSVLMTNPFHLLEVGEFAGSISGLMQGWIAVMADIAMRATSALVRYLKAVSNQV